MKYLFFLLYFSLIALLLRYPLSIHPTWVPLDPNFPFHALSAWDLSLEGSPFYNYSIEWPTGAAVRYLAWPLLLIALALEGYFSPIEAFNIATILWLTLQGFGVFLISRSWIPHTMARLSLATLALINPQHLIALGNGQFENVAPFFLLLCFWAGRKSNPLIGITALLLCSFSSPYIGFLGMLLFLLSNPFSLRTLVTLGFSAALTIAYYSPVNDANLHESSLPAPATLSEKATISSILSPRNTALTDGRAISSPSTRWKEAFSPSLEQKVYDNKWSWSSPSAGSFLGYSFLCFGLFGILRNRSQQNQRFRTFHLWGSIALLISLGSIVDLGFVQVYFLWHLSSFLPGIENMQATYRFLAGPSLMLAMGIALFPWKKWIPFLSLIAILESLFISPAYWPLPIQKPLLSTEVEEIEEPFVFWPAAPSISSHKITMLSLITEKPIAVFSDSSATIPDFKGRHNAGKGLNRQGQTLEEWSEFIKNHSNIMLQFRGDYESNNNPISAHRKDCYQSYCRWYFKAQQPEY